MNNTEKKSCEKQVEVEKHKNFLKLKTFSLKLNKIFQRCLSKTRFHLFYNVKALTTFTNVKTGRAKSCRDINENVQILHALTQQHNFPSAANVNLGCFF